MRRHGLLLGDRELLGVRGLGCRSTGVRGVSFQVRAGEILVIPAHVPHEAIALEDTVDIDFFAPRREEWIRGDDAYLRQGIKKG